jgi:hypothetical protein
MNYAQEGIDSVSYPHAGSRSRAKPVQDRNDALDEHLRERGQAMAIRKRTIRRMSPVARKLAKLANESQSTMRKLKYLIGDVQELEWTVKTQSLNEEDVFDVQPKDSRRPNSKDLSGSQKTRDSHDQMGERSHRTSASRKRRRPRNKRKRF